MEWRWPLGLGLGLLLLLLLCTPLPPGARAKEVTLMDTSTAQGELGWLLDPEDGWSGMQQMLNGTPLYMYQDCAVQGGGDTDHWLRSNWIYRGEEASQVYVELQFTVRDCKSFPGGAGPLGCKETFNLLFMESDQDVGIQLRRAMFQKVTTVAADESFTIRDLASGLVKMNTERSSLGLLTRRGLYLAFHNPGACVALVSVRVFYQRCPEAVHGLARFPDTLPTPTRLVEVTGTCLPHAQASPSGAPRMHCSSEGEWLVPVGRCHCEPGYEEGGEKCHACPGGSYRANVDSPRCLKCPQHSLAESEGATICACESGHHRAPGEGPQAACTRPPSAPQNLSFSVSGTQFSLHWAAPADMGGRQDVRYSVGCSQCRGAAPGEGPCQPCAGNVHFSPGASELTAPAVRVEGLEPFANYTFHVEAHNGVSGLGSAKPSRTWLSVHMGHTESPVGLSLRLVRKEPRQLELTWAGSRPRSPGGNLTYELHVLNQNEERHQMVLEPRVLLTELQPDTTYIVRVRMLTPLGPGPFSPDHEFRTSPPVSKGLSGGEIVAIIFGVLLGVGLLLGMFVFRSRKRRLRQQQRQLDRVTNVNRGDKQRLKPYVDLLAEPMMYEDPALGALDFTQELDPAWLIVDTVIGEGEFGEVYQGTLRIPSQDCRTVAIKTLKDTSPDGQWWNFFREATIMGQFNHPHILRLEGVVTKRKPIMIITEFMENGALDAFLREREDQLVPAQLVAMLLGIASGMTYLSDHSYVHRDLAARNILVSQNLCCKVSDFGLTRLLNNKDGTYETQGGKIPIRWTAPEAIANRIFSTASDVWSFGIVMWEVLSFGDKPYGELSNQEVMKSIEDGYRLPPPVDCPAALYELMKNCWAYNSDHRPHFHQLKTQLERLLSTPHTLRTMANFDPKVTLRLPSLSGSDGIPYRSVPEWLESIRMKRYILNFRSAGLDTMECVLDLTAEDLVQMGITLPGHQKRILCSIQGFKD
ncbi:unnamed protein product [Pipistrellus nathusii]|uniref:receptor protein-tyrosine kinase n=1 Tax=Pipistrellus nathusii TaxID=59473 RepID=A0ABN9ZCM9_PIPNA